MMVMSFCHVANVIVSFGVVTSAIIRPRSRVTHAGSVSTRVADCQRNKIEGRYAAHDGVRIDFEACARKDDWGVGGHDMRWPRSRIHAGEPVPPPPDGLPDWRWVVIVPRIGVPVIGAAAILAAIAALLNARRTLVALFVASFFPFTLFFMLTPGIFRWFAVAEMGYVVAAILLGTEEPAFRGSA
jgi:hypothetical protein